MSVRSTVDRYLDPGEALGEVLFCLIMALTFTVAERFLTAESEFDARALIVAAIGCNIAWGVIDAVLFVLGSLFHRSRRARFFRRLKSARNEKEALAAVEDEFALEDEFLEIHPEDGARFYQSILALNTRALPARVSITRGDLVSAAIIFVLVAASGLPGMIPFMLLEDSYLALRVSNGVLLLLLFIAGYWWAHYTDARPWMVGAAVMILGLCMVLLAVILGG
jgi:VIT1/CCC1 family predicted Fe2+/Mn2+ transporter